MNASVRVGRFVATEPADDAVRLRKWKNQWMVLYTNIHIHCQHIWRSQGRVQRIQDNLTRAELDGVSRRHIEEAEVVLERHRDALVWRPQDIKDLVTMFPEFWVDRPAETDEYLKAEWFSTGDREDESVIELMCELVGGVWLEVADVYAQRADVVNKEEVVF